MSDQCQICAAEPWVVVLSYDSFNGPATQRVCPPCALSGFNRGKNHIIRTESGEAVATDIKSAAHYFDGTRPTELCPGCGESTHGFHWHFWTGRAAKMHKHPDSGGSITPDRGSRVYFCSRDCCPLCDTPEPEETWDEEEDFVWDDEDDDEDWDF